MPARPTTPSPAQGAWPVMLTPFADDRSIEWDTVDRYTDWLVAQGSAGIFTVSLSSEMYHLSAEERVALAGRVAERAGGRVPVIASAIAPAGDVEALVAEGRRLGAVGVDAVVLISSLIAAPHEPDTVLRERTLRIAEGLDGVALGVYECPFPYKRLLPIELVAELAASGQVVFYKDTSHSVPTMLERIDAVRGSAMGWYNAQISSLVETQRAGGDGFSGYAANIYPELVQALCEAASASGIDTAAVRELQQLLTIAEHSVNAGYPTAAKFQLAHSSSVPIRAVSRAEPSAIGAHAGAPLIELGRYIADRSAHGLDGLGVAVAAR